LSPWYVVNCASTAIIMANMLQSQLSPFVLALALGLAGRSFAQFPPPVTYDTILRSPINPNITISYKEPDAGTCATALSTQKQYSGYVTLPSFTLEPYQQNYSINTFFWFFEARNSSKTAPLTIWLNGGPGSSSMIGLFREMGPCEVVQRQDGSFATQPNIWGWDRSSNLLFFDQPTQVGFSYDEPVNASVDLRSGDIDEPMPLPPGTPAWSFLNGTLPSNNMDYTQNSTVIAANAAWHFLQGFLSAFPRYNPGLRPNTTKAESTGVNLFAESYGGQYGPTFADFFEDQNERRRTGEIPANKTLEIKLATLGIVNGMVDTLIQGPSIASFPYNNTYNLQTIGLTGWLNLHFEYTNDCQPQVQSCRQLMKVTDPSGEGEKFDNITTATCAGATDQCASLTEDAIRQSGRDAYDIRVKPPSSFPNLAYLEYLNSANVQRSLGVKVNYTESNQVVYEAFGQTGDVVRGAQLKKLAGLIERGVRIAFIYGDADILCNWVGGEAVSLELARITAYNTTFPAAGYADVVANDFYVGGQVRQYGNLSFTRIYDAGHMVPAYQPETAFVVFSRIIQGNDIGMGHDVDLTSFGTQGPAHSDHKNKVPPQPKAVCWTRDINDTCSLEERQQISNGLGIVKNGVWFAEDAASPSATSRIRGGIPDASTRKPVEHTVTAIDLTGVYTATATPQAVRTSGATSLRMRPPFAGMFAKRQEVKLPFPTPSRDSPGADDRFEGDEDSEGGDNTTKIGLAAGLGGGLGGLLLL
jgi:carboxypeptidase C (cathepsin A)